MYIDAGLIVETHTVCNNTCCTYDGSEEFCFSDYNFTDFNEIKVFPVWEVAVRWIIALPIAFIGILGNLTVIAILLKNRLLMRTNVNIFILNMAVSDLILAIAGPIPFTVRCLHQFWVLGRLWCHLDGLIQVTVMQVSVTSLSIISIDRLLGILTPSYSHLKKWQALLSIAGIWVLSCILGVPFYIYRNFGINEWADLTEVYCEEYLSKTKYYWLVIIVALNWIPLMIMTTCYLHLFVFFKKNALKTHENGLICCIKNKKRLLKMLFVMILAFVCCWMPLQAFIIYREKIVFMNEGRVNAPKIYNSILEVTQYIVYLYPVINPFIYSLMHHNFKNGFRITFPCFFKDEADFILTRGNGSRAYVWSRTSVRHTIHATSYEANRRNRLRNRSPRRTFSYNEGTCDIKSEKILKKKSVSFGRRLSDISGTIERITNETERISNETERISNEAERISNETERISNEAERSSNEAKRSSRHTSIVPANHEITIRGINSLLLLDVTSSTQNSMSRSSSLIPSGARTAEPMEEILTREQVFDALRSQGSPQIPKHLRVSPKRVKPPKNPSGISKAKIFTFDFNPKIVNSYRKQIISRNKETEIEDQQINKIIRDTNDNPDKIINKVEIPEHDRQSIKKFNSNPGFLKIQNSLKHLGIKN